MHLAAAMASSAWTNRSMYLRLMKKGGGFCAENPKLINSQPIPTTLPNRWARTEWALFIRLSPYWRSHPRRPYIILMQKGIFENKEQNTVAFTLVEIQPELNFALDRASSKQSACIVRKWSIQRHCNWMQGKGQIILWNWPGVARYLTIIVREKTSTSEFDKDLCS